MAPVFGSLTVNASAANRGNSTVNTTHDVGAGANRTVVCVTLQFSDNREGDPDVTSVTYNGVALTVRATAAINTGSSEWLHAEIWTLDNPASGSNTGAVTYDSINLNCDAIFWSRNTGAVTYDSINLNCDAIFWSHYTGANNGVGTNVGASTGISNNPSTTFTTDASDSMIVAGACVFGGDSDPFTPGSGVTERADGATGTSITDDIGYTGLEKPATGGSDTIDTTASAADDWAIVAVEILAAADERTPRHPVQYNTLAIY
jgi:hypothetical protein